MVKYQPVSIRLISQTVIKKYSPVRPTIPFSPKRIVPYFISNAFLICLMVQSVILFVLYRHIIYICRIFRKHAVFLFFGCSFLVRDVEEPSIGI